MYKTLAVAAATLAFSATAASAAVVIIDGSNPGNPAENVLLNSGAVGTTVLGTTNQTGTSVTFKGLESLSEPSNGQARIESADGAYTSLNFFLTNPSLGFTSAEFNINAGTSGPVTISALDSIGTSYSLTSSLTANGQNFFNLITNGGSIIKSVTITSQANITDTRQIRLGGVTAGAVPEPATWGMLIMGFGMVGAGMRLRRKSASALA